MNILFTSAGRRNELIRFFHSLPDVRKIVACDANRFAASFNACTKGYIAPPITDDSYEAFLLDLCERESIELLITLNDHELPILARLKPQLASIGVQALVSDIRVIDICWDKTHTDRFLRKSGFATPNTYSVQDVHQGKTQWPLIIKPRFGTASLGVEIAESSEDFDLLFRYAERSLGRSILHVRANATDLLIQEAIVGDEYAVDVINDLKGSYQGCVIKKKLSTRGGDADCVMTVHDDRISQWCRRFAKSLGHIGNADLDLIVRDQTVYCVDINPRFGGAYPFSHLSGVNVPSMIVACLKKKPDPECLSYQAGIITARTEQYVVLTKHDQLID